MVATRTVRTGVNPNVVREKFHPGEFLVSIVENEHSCHENASVAGGVSGIAHNSVLVDGGGAFAGIVYEGVPAGMTLQRAVLMRGPAEVSEARLVFPEAADGADAGTDTIAETAALRVALKAAMKSAGIVVRN